MKTIIFLFFSFSIYSQSCEGLYKGTFEIETTIGKFIIEKHNEYQLEYSEDLKILCLNKILKIGECEYKVKCHKVINYEYEPKPNMDDILNVKIYKTEGNSFYFYSHIVGSKSLKEGVMVKTNDEMSELFKKLLKDEEVQN